MTTATSVVHCRHGEVGHALGYHEKRPNHSFHRHRPHNLAKAIRYVCYYSRRASGQEVRRIFSDAQGLELVENQKESLVGRKALADRTKGA